MRQKIVGVKRRFFACTDKNITQTMNKNYDCNNDFIYCLRPNGRTVRFNIADIKTLNKFHRNLNLNEGIQKK